MHLAFAHMLANMCDYPASMCVCMCESVYADRYDFIPLSTLIPQFVRHNISLLWAILVAQL